MAWGDSEVRGLAEDAEGALWIGVTDGTLYRRLPDRRVERYPSTEGLPRAEITHLLADRKGRIWVGRENGLYRSVPAPAPGREWIRTPLHTKRQAAAYIASSTFSNRGKATSGWACIDVSLSFPRMERPSACGPKTTDCPAAGALSLGQDRDGNLWLGTNDLGAFKLAAGGILTYSTEDGIGIDAVIVGRRDPPRRVVHCRQHGVGGLSHRVSLGRRF